ncbi:hypothetical protein AKJ41_02025 [candidate division MSBL1 archaeon SCGC-AAA259O05]|uniref:Uncharacterized protein n=1 Tax=candidate division MSBL1 archaeon SCGC-AAA259O05 TaxID=1698271 RepID=A0A133V4D3_9EURY|nr:hypothetical protein AKJ41_02025 [candidate division MSBL1 archaeon SCGC-AAA259O05]
MFVLIGIGFWKQNQERLAKEEREKLIRRIEKLEEKVMMNGNEKEWEGRAKCQITQEVFQF